MSDFLKIFDYPFERGALSPPRGQKICAMYVEATAPILQHFSDNDWHFFHPFYAQAQALKNLSQSVNAEITSEADMVLCHVPRQSVEAKGVLAKGYRALKTGGILIAAAANDAGGKRIAQWFRDLGIAASMDSKYKARIVWGRKDGENATAQEWHDNGDIQPVLGGSYVSQPGLFSWDRKDSASTLLLNNIPEFSGKGADYGCGWGYLTKEILARHPDLQITGYDHDLRAIECFHRNVPQAEGVWSDLTKDVQRAAFDFVICNPPFHAGKQSNIALGQKIIENAAASLKKNRPLVIVANTHLPYEPILDRAVHTWSIVAQEGGFKVFHAWT